MQFTEAQFAFALRQSETSARVEEICRQLGYPRRLFPITEEVRWFRGSRIAQVEPAGGGNAPLKKLVADLSLDAGAAGCDKKKL